MKSAILALLIGLAALPSSADAQQSGVAQTITGTRLDVLASGEATRVPDVAVISAGVVSRASSASAALADASARMKRMVLALKQMGTADRDIQTSNVSLNAEYRYADNQPPQLVGYNATNTVSIQFRDIANSGKILDRLVAEGANELSGPSLIVDHPEAALDEARAKAVAAGRSRADLYAHSLGLRVVRVVSVSETETNNVQPAMAMLQARALPATKIEPGEQKLKVSLAMVFELQ